MWSVPRNPARGISRASARSVQPTITTRLLLVPVLWLVAGCANLHEVFEQARAHKPAVLFFDEVDALGASRADLRHSGGRHLINQFLSELDGIDSANADVLVLAATNAPWHLDPAFRRPGRFDRVLFVPPPDTPARAEILRPLPKRRQ